MKKWGIFVLILLSSCAPSLTRDSKLLGKIKARSPELFKTELDTVFVEEQVDSIGMILETDLLTFFTKLKEYEDVVDSLQGLDSSFSEAGIQKRRTLFATKNKLMQELSKGAFVETVSPLIDPGGRFHLMVKFNPKDNSLSIVKGTITDRVITKKETVTIREKPTMWEAVKKLWPIWVILLVIIGLALNWLRGPVLF